MGAVPPPPPGREPRILELRYPFEFGSELVDRLVVQRPTAAQLWDLPIPAGGAGSMTFGHLLGIGARCAGVSEALVRRLEAEDAMALVTIVGESFASSPQTGP